MPRLKLDTPSAIEKSAGYRNESIFDKVNVLVAKTAAAVRADLDDIDVELQKLVDEGGDFRPGNLRNRLVTLRRGIIGLINSFNGGVADERRRAFPNGSGGRGTKKRKTKGKRKKSKSRKR